MASFVIKDAMGRDYPSRPKRLAPDFFFQEQIYRADGESVYVFPPATFAMTCGRGPEYLPETRTVSIDRSGASALDFQLRRWIDPSSRGWYSGDHHIHAAGCAHYESPTEGVRARGHDAPRAGRGAQRRRRVELGPQLLPSTAVLRGT